MNTNEFEVTVYEIIQENSFESSLKNIKSNICCVTNLQKNLNIQCTHSVSTGKVLDTKCTQFPKNIQIQSNLKDIERNNINTHFSDGTYSTVDINEINTSQKNVHNKISETNSEVLLKFNLKSCRKRKLKTDSGFFCSKFRKNSNTCRTQVKVNESDGIKNQISLKKGIFDSKSQY